LCDVALAVTQDVVLLFLRCSFSVEIDDVSISSAHVLSVDVDIVVIAVLSISKSKQS
jgi:hypothetical protein